MRRWLFPVALVAALSTGLSACADADKGAALDLLARFHGAVNAGDVAAIDAMLAGSARQLRPGLGTARAFGALTRRHGRYLGGEMAGLTGDAGDGGLAIAWSARYAQGPVSEQFVLVREGGGLKIASYTDDPAP